MLQCGKQHILESVKYGWSSLPQKATWLSYHFLHEAFPTIFFLSLAAGLSTLLVSLQDPVHISAFTLTCLSDAAECRAGQPCGPLTIC